jgi:hypothetical protein
MAVLRSIYDRLEKLTGVMDNDHTAGITYHSDSNMATKRSLPAKIACLNVCVRRVSG